MKIKWIGLILLSCGLLVGCEEATTISIDESKVEAEKIAVENEIEELMPPGVKDDTVSKETYLEVVRMIDELPLFGTRNTSYINEIKFNYDVIKTEDFQSNYGKLLNDYDVFIKGFNANPSTSADFELNEHIIDIVYNTEAYIDEMRMYIKDGDSYYNENAMKYLNERQVSLEALINAMDKYGLFNK